MLFRDAEFGQRSKFLLPANLGELCSRQVWVLRPHISSRKSHDVDLISVRLQQSERAMRQSVIVGMSADQHDCFASPLLDRNFRLLRRLLRRSQSRMQHEK